MEQRDLIKDEIERLGKALAAIVADFFGLDLTFPPSEIINNTNARIQSELDLDMAMILSSNPEDLRIYLSQKKLAVTQLETLSLYLRRSGELLLVENRVEAKRSLETAIELLSIADEISESVGALRLIWKDEIVKTLSEYN